MRRAQRKTRTKRKASIAEAGAHSREALEQMAADARYASSSYHRAVPDGGSAPMPRPDKTICSWRDGRYPDALKLLRTGFRRGMVSTNKQGAWPRNVWAVDCDGTAYEAQLSNREVGQYHGYPMKMAEAFTRHVLLEWEKRKWS